MQYKEIYKQDVLKYITEEEYNKFGPRTHFYKFSRYIIALGKFKETNKTEVQIIKTKCKEYNIHKICNYIIILIQEMYIRRNRGYNEDVYFRCTDKYDLRDVYYELDDITEILNSLCLYNKIYTHIDEDGNLLLSSRSRLSTRAEDRITGKYFDLYY